MKKTVVFLLLVSMLVSLAACGQSYRKINVPKELSLDTSVLSEDTSKMMSVTDATPLIAALPEEKLYVYATDPSIVGGVLFKFDGLVQYFPWTFTPQIAEPEVYLADYNGDGRKDIAFTFCDTASTTKHNENLHVLLRTDDGFTDCMYPWKSASVDTSMRIVVDDNDDGTFTAHLNGASVTASLDTAGLGAYRGVIADDWQDFALGDTITMTVKPGLVFNDSLQPVYDVFVCTADMQIVDGVLSPKDMQIATP